MVRIELLARSQWAAARWLVIAPHPDDETLGAGALIAHAAPKGRLGGIVFLTDGTGSHPEGTSRIASIRRQEARHAIHRLGAAATPVMWLGWRDAHPYPSDSPTFMRDADRLAYLIRWLRVDAIAVTDLTEAHCDHIAAYQLAKAASRRARRRLAVFGYHVWSEAPTRVRRIATPAMPIGRRRHALLAHRSQTSPVIGIGFRLPRGKCRLPAQDILTLREVS